MRPYSLTRQLDIGGLPIFIFDTALPEPTIASRYRALQDLRYESDHASSKSTNAYREWVSEMDLIEFSEGNLFAEMKELLHDCFPEEKIGFFSVFCNCISYGCHTFRHQDGGERCFSALYYANPNWELDWGGETTFFDDNGNAVFCVAPVPGRIVILDGRVFHRAGMPSRACQHRRLTVSLRCDNLGEGAA